jgi:hypothetical protein
LCRRANRAPRRRRMASPCARGRERFAAASGPDIVAGRRKPILSLVYQLMRYHVLQARCVCFVICMCVCVCACVCVRVCCDVRACVCV